MTEIAKKNWKAYATITWKKNQTFSSMVVYKDVNIIGNNLETEFFDEHSQGDGVLNMAIGHTILHVFDAQQKVACFLTPVKVSYEKQIYKPGRVDIEFNVTDGVRDSYASQLRALFLGKNFGVDVVTYDAKQKKHIVIAQHYYVQSLHLSHRSGNAAVAVLTCYSPDYKMTIKKYSQVYSGKKFAEEIVKPGVARYNMGSAQCVTNVNDLLFLSYSKSDLKAGGVPQDKPGDTSREEILQPYLMQYDESFYNFISRIAYRCGEFLYFEHGNLHLGLPEQARKALLSTPNGLKQLVPYCITYPELTESLSDDLLFTSGNAMPDAAPLKGLAYRNDNDLMPFTENDIPKIDLWKNSRFIVTAYSEIAKAQSLGSVVGALIGSVLTVLTTQVDLKIIGQRSKQLKAYKNFIGKKTENWRPDFTQLNSLQDNLCETFYGYIAESENNVAETLVTLDFDEAMPDVYLADAVTLNDGIHEAYIVTSMKGEFTMEAQNHTVEILPRAEKITGLLGQRNGGQLAAGWIPPRCENTAPVANISGMEAIVTDNVDPCRLGRVRVKYTWQGEAKESTGWLDVITPFAGKNGRTGGMFMMPAVDTHVIVNFIDNYPYVVGSLYTKDKEAPGYEWEYENVGPLSQAYLPGNQVRTIQSECGHGITFIDGPDTHFLTDNLIPPLGQVLNSVSHFKKKDVISGIASSGGGMKLHDASGFYSISMNSTMRTVDISSPLGTVSLNAFTGITISAPNGNISIVGKNIDIKAGNNLTLQSGTNSLPKPSLGERIKNAVMATLGEKAALNGSVAIAKLTGFNLARAVDFSFLRASWEIIMRPVEGTLTITTPRNIVMTAGKGQALIPSSLLAKERGTDKGLVKSLGQSATEGDPNLIPRIKDVFETVSNTIDAFYLDKVTELRIIAGFLRVIMAKLKKHVKGDVLKFLVDGKVETAQSAYKAIFGNYDDSKLDCWNMKPVYDGISKEKAPLKEIDLHTKADLRQYFDCLSGFEARKILDAVPAINDAIRVANKIIELISKQTSDNLLKDLKDRLTACIPASDGFGLTVSNIKASIQVIHYLSPFDKSGLLLSDDEFEVWTENKIAAKAEIFTALIKQLDDKLVLTGKDGPESVSTVTAQTMNSWVDKLTLKKDENKKEKGLIQKLGVDKFLEGVTKVAHQDEIIKLRNKNGEAGPRSVFDISEGGSILMSNNETYTYQMKENGFGFEPKENVSAKVLSDFLKKETTWISNQERPAYRGILDIDNLDESIEYWL